MAEESLLVYCLLVSPLLLFACIALFFACTGVRFRKFFCYTACIALAEHFVVLVAALLNCWPLNESFPRAIPRLIASLTITGAVAILGVGLGILSAPIPEVPVYIVGVLGGGLGCKILSSVIVAAPSGTLLSWLLSAVGGALGAACVHFFEPYAAIGGSAVLGSASLCKFIGGILDRYSDFKQPTNMNPLFRKRIELPYMAELVLIAGAIGVQFWLGNYRRTCRQAREQRAAKDLESVPAPPSPPPIQLGYSKKDFF